MATTIAAASDSAAASLRSPGGLSGLPAEATAMPGGLFSGHGPGYLTQELQRYLRGRYC